MYGLTAWWFFTTRPHRCHVQILESSKFVGRLLKLAVLVFCFRVFDVRTASEPA